MTATLSKKAYRDLRRHPLRTILTVITVAAAVGAIWMLTIPRALDAAMADRHDRDAAHHIRLSPQNLWFSGEGSEPPPAAAEVSADELEGLADLPNVAAVDSRPMWQTRLLVGGTEHDVWLVGVNDFDRQEVNVVQLEAGRIPASGDLEAVASSASSRMGRLTLAAGDVVDVRAGDDRFYPFTITGLGGTVGLNPGVDDETPVLYVGSDIVHLFTAHTGFNSIEVRVENPERLDETYDAVRGYLGQVAPDAEFWRFAEINRPTGWAGQEKVDRMLPLLYVLAVIAAGSALILIGTTMNTLIRGQARQIGILRSMGATRSAIRNAYLRSTLLLGGAGAALGTLLGVGSASALGRYAQSRLLGITPTWRLDIPIALLAMAVGMAATTGAALPAIRRAMNISVQSALGDQGTGTGFGDAVMDTVVARAPFRRQTTRIGVRNVTRQKQRSLAAVVQVALGVGAAVAFGAFAVTGVSISADTLERAGSDVLVYGERTLLDPDMVSAVTTLDGVAALQPTVDGWVEYDGGELMVRGLPVDPIYEPDLTAGAWFTADDVAAARSVGVMGASLAAATATEVGDTFEIRTKSGIRNVHIVGVDAGLVQDGRYLWMPLTAVMEFEELSVPPIYWIETTSPEPQVVDRVVVAITGLLEEPGRPVTVHARYADLAAARQEDKVVGGVIQVLALPILAVGMIGMVSAMTTNVLERTREIGVLRGIGARSRHLRRIFRAEGSVLSLLGWLAGLPIGYGLAVLIVRQFGRALHTDLDLIFPVWLVLTALLGVMIVSRVALRAPLRRATRMQPGVAIRYE